MDFTINLLKELTETPGIPGYETPIRCNDTKISRKLWRINPR